MSNSKMLIDASHPEETRVVVLKGNRVEEFDFESASKKQLRGNIYLAKVTRVEPSLQAAFVEYGGNRHGFLAFSEIHPDYYQIPIADRQALLEEEARAHRDEEEEVRGEGRSRDARRSGSRGNGEGGESGERAARSDGRGEGREGRGERSEGRGERSGGRGERGQRRSRRHRRDHVQASPLDRRGLADESVSEPAFDGTDAVEGVEFDLVVDQGADAGSDPSAVAAGTDWTAGIDAEAERPVSEPRDHEEAEAAPVMSAETDATAAAAHDPHEDTAGAPATAVASVVPEAAAIEAAAGDAPEHAGSGGSGEAHDDHSATSAEAMPAETGASDEDATEEGSHTSPAIVPLEARDTREDGHPGAEPNGDDHHGDEHQAAEHEEEHVEQIGGDALSDVAPRPTRLRRHYKIQEVIKRRQILLIQVVKEERGNKGAALTTYLSLAGRYSVLMPNTAKGGGISRKITDGEDRKRLKAIANELDVPEGMGVILRTAGASRSPIEVKRDFEYLLRMWESVRELTLKSSAPSLVYEEGSLIKRSIRDLYSKEVEEIVVSGEAGYVEARDFMRMLMPGNVKAVQLYRDPQPIFAKSGVEAQLDAMFSPHVTLKSGGYLVINQTEALVAIDVNSGRSTREHNIEDTALRTNLEAADEVARQLRLRDLAGLIVVDFIDMEEGRNNRAVERRIKEALKNDRARIQIGRISHFGLLEMSRQRIRTGVLEGSTVVCPHCAGAGTVRSTASIALHVLRLVEDVLIKDASHDLIVRSRAEVALYMLNQKRAKLVEIEQRFGVSIMVAADPTLTGMVYHAIERGEPALPPVAPAPRLDLVRVDSIAPIFEPESEGGEDAGEEAERESAGEETAEAASSDQGEGDGRRRKRRRRRRGRDREGSAGDVAGEASQGGDDAAGEDDAEEDGDLGAMGARTGGDDRSGPTSSDDAPAPLAGSEAEPETAMTVEVLATPTILPLAGLAGEAVVEAVEEAPKRRRSRRTAARIAEEAAAGETPAAVAAEPLAGDADAPARPRRRRPSRARAAEAAPEAGVAEPAAETAAVEAVAVTEPEPAADVPAVQASAPAPEAPAETAAAAPPPASEAASTPTVETDPDRPKRSGWWQRAKASFGS